MKKTKHTVRQIIDVIKQHDSSRQVADICRELGIHKGTFYNWKKKYSGMDKEKIKELEEENRKLKQMYADMALDHKMLKVVLSKKR